MSKKVLILSTSLRGGSNSAVLAEEFAKGAREAGHAVQVVGLEKKNIEFCTGCLACQKTQGCVIRDDANKLVGQMRNADVLVFATPIYFHEMSGRMKTLLDRTNPLFPADYAFREIYLLATAADEEETAMDGAVRGIQGWIDCFEKTRLAGVVRGVGVDGAGAVRDRPGLMDAAYQMGKTV